MMGWIKTFIGDPRLKRRPTMIGFGSLSVYIGLSLCSKLPARRAVTGYRKRGGE